MPIQRTWEGGGFVVNFAAEGRFDRYAGVLLAPSWRARLRKRCRQPERVEDRSGFVLLTGA